MNKLHYLMISGTLVFSMLGCVDSDSTDTGNSVGTFIDASVSGLNYVTSSGIEGVTTEIGNYEYKPGDTISFTLGKLKLGTNAATAVVTPTKLGDTIKAANIAYLIQNLDIDEVSADGIIHLPSIDLLEELIPADTDLYDNEAIDSLVLHVRNEVENALNINLPVISRVTAYNNAIYNVNQVSKKVLYGDLTNKTYTLVSYSKLFGGEVVFDTANFQRDYSFAYSQNDINLTAPYSHYINGYNNVLDINFNTTDYGDGIHEYYKFLDYSEDIISVCISSNPTEDTLDQKIENCVEANAYLVSQDKVSDLISNLSVEATLQSKEQIVNFSDLQNRYLYRVNIAQKEFTKELYAVEDAIYIENNGMTNFYTTVLEYENPITNWPNEFTPIDTTYSAVFANNQITFYNNVGSIVNIPNNVYKYDLKDVKISTSDLVHIFSPELDDKTINAEDELVNLLPVKSFYFADGAIYCEVLYGCRLDKTAFEQFQNQLSDFYKE